MEAMAIDQERGWRAPVHLGVAPAPNRQLRDCSVLNISRTVAIVLIVADNVAMVSPWICRLDFRGGRFTPAG
ncbi:hypothetical protein SAMN05444580_105262 [Rhodococcus tukisamuensis]|uniref:Uncharacterized protein n=1 Tax=Rhodococcus tukisamuensis TaxID=168276 RepID=A0A1G6W864_9NOCA|nr:hypothetical protein SAMN05444580_105262 [Rhodococcus tukisamuensis]